MQDAEDAFWFRPQMPPVANPEICHWQQVLPGTGNSSGFRFLSVRSGDESIGNILRFNRPAVARTGFSRRLHV
jgi:hypothetical protein